MLRDETKFDNVTLKNREDIAVMKRDLQYLTTQIDNLTNSVNEMKKDGFVTKVELDYAIKPLQEKVDTISSGINKVLWLIISTVLLAILSLVIRPQLPF